MTDEKLLLETERFRIVEITQPTASGSRRRAVVRHPGAVTIVPLVEGDRVCLIKQFRPAIGQTLLELPAGTRDPGEDALTTAQRELAEETGYRAKRWKKLNEFFLSPGILDENMHLFVASELAAGEPARELGENIENLVVPLREAIGMIDDGRIADAKTIVGLLLCERWLRCSHDPADC